MGGATTVDSQPLNALGYEGNDVGRKLAADLYGTLTKIGTTEGATTESTARGNSSRKAMCTH